MTRSILDNPYKNIELILVNDGSTDDSLSLCKGVASSDVRVKVISQDNKGASAARNRGIEVATGDYIHICDADDEVTRCFYSDAMTIANKYEPDVIRCNIRTQYNEACFNDSIINQPYEMVLDRQYIVEEVIPYMIGIKIDLDKKTWGHCSLITKRTVIMTNDIRYDEKRTKEEDHSFMVNVLAYAQSMVFIRETNYHYIKHSGSLISRYSQRFNNICTALDLYEKLFGEIYDFGSQTKIRYNIQNLIECLDYVFIHRKNCNPQKEVVAILSSNEAKQWFDIFKPTNKYETILKKCVKKERFKTAYLCAAFHYISLRAGNLKRKITRKLFGKR